LKRENRAQKVTPFLWFDGRAEEAMNIYTAIFKNSRVSNVTLGSRRPGQDVVHYPAQGEQRPPADIPEP
jgi:predicted 3-demethylubiquinone-9 3-methyltransferase (glyoxalase superfamily)